MEQSTRTSAFVTRTVEVADTAEGTAVRADPPPASLRLATSPSAPSAASAKSSWRSAYQLAAVLADLATAVAAVSGAFAAFVTRLGADGDHATHVRPVHFVLLVLLPIAWVVSIALNRGYESRVLGAGSLEYSRLGRAFLQLTVVTAFAAYATKTDPSRGFVLLALLMMLALGVVGRQALRGAVRRSRREGRAVVSVLAIGTAGDVIAFDDTLRNQATAEATGWRVAAACLLDGDRSEGRSLASGGIDVVGDVDDVRAAVLAAGVSTVAVVSPAVSGERLRWISWQLEGTEADLVLLPGLTEVAGRRLSIQQVGALPLLYVAQPEFTGLRRVIKGGFDRLAALLALVLLSPALLMIAAAVRLTSRGPALFLQTRVGKDGRTFRMIKFRSMRRDAEDGLAELVEHNEVPGGTMFKIRRDPRVTRIGQLMRRYSLDELPQLINVLCGSMSLVGPRPPLPSEVASYGGDVRRRLLVKPGMTGLWQISGRSDLSWEESVRIDLRYVESWSLSLDLLVIAKTAHAVLSADGAY